MVMKYIWIKNKRYYLYDVYPTWAKAINIAKQQRKKNKKNRYFIVTYEKGNAFGPPEKRYALYMTKVFRLFM